MVIAKIAMQLQHEKTPKYDGVFTAVGSFHTEIAFFEALGKITDESGGPYILEECGLSIKSFISGLSYNRFKRMHATMVASFAFWKILRKARGCRGNYRHNQTPG